MEVADHESRGYWMMALKSTVPTDARAYFFKAPGPLGGYDSPAVYENWQF